MYKLFCRNYHILLLFCKREANLHMRLTMYPVLDLILRHKSEMQHFYQVKQLQNLMLYYCLLYGNIHVHLLLIVLLPMYH